MINMNTSNSGSFINHATESLKYAGRSTNFIIYELAISNLILIHYASTTVYVLQNFRGRPLYVVRVVYPNYKSVVPCSPFILCLRNKVVKYTFFKWDAIYRAVKKAVFPLTNSMEQRL